MTETASSNVDAFLAHYGVRGMKWGVRRSSSQLAKATPSKGGSSKSAAEKTLDAPGTSKKGSSKKEKIDDSPDAVVFNALRQKAKEGGINALSNDEIRVLTTRASAIDQYTRAFPGPVKKPTKRQMVADYLVSELLIGTGKVVIKDLYKDSSKHLGQDFLRKKNLLPPAKPPAPAGQGNSSSP